MKLLNICMHLHKNVSFPLIEAHSVFSLFISMRIHHHHHHCSTWSAGSLFFRRSCALRFKRFLNIDSLSLLILIKSSINTRHLCCDTVASRSLCWCPCAWNIAGVVIGAHHVHCIVLLLWIDCRLIHGTERNHWDVCHKGKIQCSAHGNGWM